MLCRVECILEVKTINPVRLVDLQESEELRQPKLLDLSVVCCGIPDPSQFPEIKTWLPVGMGASEKMVFLRVCAGTAFISLGRGLGLDHGVA